MYKGDLRANMDVHIINFRELKLVNPAVEDVVLAVSKGNGWERGLSPFFVGPCSLYDGHVSKNVENGWQFTKIYKEHLDGDEISQRYWDWAKSGWSDTFAHRYPMGKGAIPEFSLWKGERLGYIDARKKIYIPLYRKAVIETYAFKMLKQKYEAYKKMDKDLFLVDYDAYMHKKLDMSYEGVVNRKDKKMGHAFVLGMLLECPEYVYSF